MAGSDQVGASGLSSCAPFHSRKGKRCSQAIQWRPLHFLPRMCWTSKRSRKMGHIYTVIKTEKVPTLRTGPEGWGGCTEHK